MEDESKVNVAAEEGDSALLAGDVYLISVFSAGTCILMLEVGGLPEVRPVPASWVRLELDDYSSHSSYPAIVQEIKAGWINFYGKLPGVEEEEEEEESQQRSLSSIIRQLVQTREDREKVAPGQTDLFLV